MITKQCKTLENCSTQHAPQSISLRLLLILSLGEEKERKKEGEKPEGILMSFIRRLSGSSSFFGAPAFTFLACWGGKKRKGQR